MKSPILFIVTAAALLLCGCNKQSDSSASASSSASEQGSATSAAVPVAQPAMTAWQQGDKTTAVSKFLEADWSAQPLFPEGSTLGLSANQLKALSDAEKQAKAPEMAAELGNLQLLGQAVMEAGDAEAAKGDTTKARKHFTALQQCGVALAKPQYPSAVQVVGQGFEARARVKLTKLGQ